MIAVIIIFFFYINYLLSRVNTNYEEFIFQTLKSSNLKSSLVCRSLFSWLLVNANNENDISLLSKIANLPDGFKLLSATPHRYKSIYEASISVNDKVNANALIDIMRSTEPEYETYLPSALKMYQFKFAQKEFANSTEYRDCDGAESFLYINHYMKAIVADIRNEPHIKEEESRQAFKKVPYHSPDRLKIKELLGQVKGDNQPTP